MGEVLVTDGSGCVRFRKQTMRRIHLSDIQMNFLVTVGFHTLHVSGTRFFIHSELSILGTVENRLPSIIDSSEANTRNPCISSITECGFSSQPWEVYGSVGV